MENSSKTRSFILVILGLEELIVFGLLRLNLNRNLFPEVSGRPRWRVRCRHFAWQWIGVWLASAWLGQRILLLGLGMFFCSDVNSLGWAVLNHPMLGILMVLTLIVILGAAPPLIRQV